jgi:hypothetical protein
LAEHGFGKWLRAGAKRIKKVEPVSLAVSVDRLDLRFLALVSDNLDLGPDRSRFRPPLRGLDASLGAGTRLGYSHEVLCGWVTHFSHGCVSSPCRPVTVFLPGHQFRLF